MTNNKGEKTKNKKTNDKQQTTNNKREKTKNKKTNDKQQTTNNKREKTKNKKTNDKQQTTNNKQQTTTHNPQQTTKNNKQQTTNSNTQNKRKPTKTNINQFYQQRFQIPSAPARMRFWCLCWFVLCWFPAAWMPLVVDAIRAKNVWEGVGGHQGAVASLTPFRHRSMIIKSSASSSKSGRFMGRERVRSWMPGSMWIGSLSSTIQWHTLCHTESLMGWHPASTCRLVVSHPPSSRLEVEN